MSTSYEATAVGSSAAWRELIDRLNSGMFHELNGRFSAFSSLLQIVAMRGEAELSLLVEMERETERLGDALELLRTIPGFRRSAKEIVAPHEFVPGLIRLAAQERGVHAIDFQFSSDPEVGAIRTDPNALGQCLLILLASAARDAQNMRVKTVRTEVSADSDHAEISVGVPPAKAEDEAQPWIATKEVLPKIADDGLPSVQASTEAIGCHLYSLGETDRFAKGYAIRIPLAGESV